MSELYHDDEMLTLADLENDRIYTPKQIGDILKVPSRRVVQAFRAGALSGIELGPKTIRITGKSVREWLNSKNTNTSLADSAEQVESSQTGNGASTSSKKGKNVGDLALASL
jgi:hypothetical protein